MAAAGISTPADATMPTAPGWNCWHWIAAAAWPIRIAAWQDGYSTAGSPGTGLGAIARLADTVRIYSRPGQGCAIMARFVERRRPRRPDPAGRHARALSGRTGVRRQLVMERHRSRSHDHDGRWLRPRCRGSARRGDRRADVLGQRRCGMRGHRRADPSRAGADARRRGGGRADRHRGARGSLRRGRQYQRDAGHRRQVAPHGLAQRHGRACRAAHPRVHLRLHRRSAGHPALRRADQPLGSRRLSGARRTAPVADRRRAAARSPARPRRCLGGRDAGQRYRARHGHQPAADRDRCRDGHRPGPQPDPPARRTDRLRRAGPDADHHRGLGDRPQRL